MRAGPRTPPLVLIRPFCRRPRVRVRAAVLLCVKPAHCDLAPLHSKATQARSLRKELANGSGGSVCGGGGHPRDVFRDIIAQMMDADKIARRWAGEHLR